MATVDFNSCLNQPVSMGTTIIAVAFNDGVVLGSDSRTSSGVYVVNRVTDKITEITNRVACLRSGSAADTQIIANVVKHQMNVNKFIQKEPQEVKLAANLFKSICYSKRELISAGIIVAGYDDVNGPQVYSIPLGGMVTQVPYAIGGSGSIYLYGFFDNNYQEGMSEEECVQLVYKALTLAIWRDGSSGGLARLAIIKKDGIRRELIGNDQLPIYS